MKTNTKKLTKTRPEEVATATFPNCAKCSRQAKVGHHLIKDTVILYLCNEHDQDSYYRRAK